MSLEHYKIVPARHPLRYIGVAFSVLIIAVVAESIFSNKNWGWPVFRQWFFDPAILQGLLMTLKLTFCMGVYLDVQIITTAVGIDYSL